MQIKVVGCSNSWSQRPVSCYCLDDTILIDCGAGARKYFKRTKVFAKNIKNIFITHLHSDHFFDLILFVNTEITYKPKDEAKSLTIYGPVGLYNILDYFVKTIKVAGPDSQNVKIEDYLNIVEISDFNKVIEVGEYKITPYKLNHFDMDDIGYVFDNGKTKLGFSGDCILDDATKNFVENFDCGFIDCYHQKSTVAHMGAEEYLLLKKTYPNKKLFAVHCDDNIYFHGWKQGIKVVKTQKKYKI